MKYSKAMHICTEVDRANFMEAINHYKAGRFRSLHSAYNWMITAFYSELGAIDGKIVMMPLPPDERPTFTQFYYFARRHMADTQDPSSHRTKRYSDMIEIDVSDFNVTLVCKAGQDNKA